MRTHFCCQVDDTLKGRFTGYGAGGSREGFETLMHGSTAIVSMKRHESLKPAAWRIRRAAAAYGGHLAEAGYTVRVDELAGTVEVPGPVRPHRVSAFVASHFVGTRFSARGGRMDDYAQGGQATCLNCHWGRLCGSATEARQAARGHRHDMLAADAAAALDAQARGERVLPRFPIGAQVRSRVHPSSTQVGTVEAVVGAWCRVQWAKSGWRGPQRGDLPERWHHELLAAWSSRFPETSCWPGTGRRPDSARKSQPNRSGDRNLVTELGRGRSPGRGQRSHEPVALQCRERRVDQVCEGRQQRSGLRQAEGSGPVRSATPQGPPRTQGTPSAVRGARRFPALTGYGRTRLPCQFGGFLGAAYRRPGRSPGRPASPSARCPAPL